MIVQADLLYRRTSVSLYLCWPVPHPCPDWHQHQSCSRPTPGAQHTFSLYTAPPLALARAMSLPRQTPAAQTGTSIRAVQDQHQQLNILLVHSPPLALARATSLPRQTPASELFKTAQPTFSLYMLDIAVMLKQSLLSGKLFILSKNELFSMTIIIYTLSWLLTCAPG